MQFRQLMMGAVAAAAMGSAQAVTVLNEGFENVPGLTASGWVFTNNSTPVGQSWIQGNSGIFTAKAGAVNSYAAVNFLSTTAVTGVVDNWLISPVLTLGGASTLKFYTQASDEGFLDLLEVRFSSGASTDVSSFSTVLAIVGDAADPSYPVGSWVAFTLTLPTVATGRFAFHYSVANALDASYVGIDSVTVNVAAVPEPATYVLLGLGLAAIGVARHRRLASAANASI